jgi:hypothetical protein
MKARGRGLKMGPFEDKKRFKLTLDPLVYQAFKLLCKQRGYGHPSRLIEDFMRACLKNQKLPLLIFRIVKEEHNASQRA